MTKTVGMEYERCSAAVAAFASAAASTASAVPAANSFVISSNRACTRAI